MLFAKDNQRFICDGDSNKFGYEGNQSDSGSFRELIILGM
jgi:hypothetical protein